MPEEEKNMASETDANDAEVSAKRGRMSEEKVRKIAVGATVGGVLLVVFLLIVLIIQFVQMGVKRADERKLDDLIAKQEKLLEGGNADLDALLNGDKMYWEAFNQDYRSHYKD